MYSHKRQREYNDDVDDHDGELVMMMTNLHAVEYIFNTQRHHNKIHCQMESR